MFIDSNLLGLVGSGVASASGLHTRQHGDKDDQRNITQEKGFAMEPEQHGAYCPYCATSQSGSTSVGVEPVIWKWCEL